MSAVVNDHQYNVCHDRLLIRKTQQEKTESGLYLSSGTQQNYQRGEIIGVGPGAMLAGGVMSPMPYEVGQACLYSEQGGIEVELGGQKYWLAPSSSVLLTVAAQPIYTKQPPRVSDR